VPLDERQERRVVTVLFADLAGSTELGERLDPEDVRELQARLFGLVNAEVERFGGVTEKFVGDAVLAVFGIPRAHEDDAERAVRAALATQGAFAAFASAVAERYGAAVGLRIGVNTGEVVAGREAAARGELMVSGDAVNVAARLQQGAEPGQVLVGERTRRATARAVTYAARRLVDAKGKSDAVEAWLAADAASESAPRRVGGLTAPLIARDEELTILTAVARRVERERAPQLVSLFGPAGVGKSRLLAELVRHLPEAIVLEGRCLPYGDEVTYRPIAEAAKAHAGVLESDSAAEAREKLRRDVEPVAGRELLVPILWTIGLELPDPAASAAEVTQRLHEAWRRYLSAIAAERTAVLAIEDAHWAAPRLLDLLDHLADSLADVPVLIACTARSELLETRPSWGAGKQNATSLTLAPLGPAEATQLVDALLGRNGTLGALGVSVLERAEGNPFFVEEMLAMLIEQGALVQREDGWHAADELGEVPLPDSVHGVIAARIDLLDDDARDALRSCSVIGRVFWPEAAGATEEAIAPLASRGLVAEHAVSSMAGMREFEFKHALTRDVAYASLPRTERRTLHRRVAEWVQEIAPDRSVEAAEIAAYHYGEALAYGEDEPAVAERASSLFLTAGRASLQRGALANAKRQFERAAELASSNVVRASALVGLGELDILAGSPAHVSLVEGVSRLDRALELAPPEAAEVRSDALAWRSRLLWLTGRWDEALDDAEAAVDALAGRPPSPQLARALARRSQLAMLRSLPEAGELAAEALAMAERVGDPFAAVNARTNIATVGALHGTPPSPAEVLAVIDDARRIGATEEAYRALVNWLWSAAGTVKVDDVLATLAEGRELLAGVPLPSGINWYLPISVALLHLLPAGRFEEADVLLADLDPERANPTNYIPWLGLRAQILLRTGDVDGAGELAQEQLELAFRSGEPQRIIPMACAYLPWAALVGRTALLRDAATRVVESVGDRWAASMTVTPAIRALTAVGEHDLLRRWLESFRSAGGVATRGRLATSSAAAEGLLALHDGRADVAVERLAWAADGDRRLGYEFDASTLDVDLASALEATGDEERALALRVRSAAFFQSIGCRNAL
jgi:class 3 adenylate cyclase/tetratricopeptide (TPR) repeat protein/ABC-type uncharacterized transport system YnjBCD ATPase subunit